MSPIGTLMWRLPNATDDRAGFKSSKKESACSEAFSPKKADGRFLRTGHLSTRLARVPPRGETQLHRPELGKVEGLEVLSAAGDRRNDRNRFALGNLGGQPIEEPDVVIGYEHVHKSPQIAVFVEETLGKSGVFGLEFAEDALDRPGLDTDCRLPRCECAKSRWYSNGDCHGRNCNGRSSN